MAALVSRIYDIKVTGYQDALKNLQALTAAFAKMDEVKRKTDEQLKQAVASGNTQAVEALTVKVKELETSLKNLDKQREKSAREVKLLAEAEKTKADAALKHAQANKVITDSIIEQDKEIDRQIALTDRRAKEKEAADNKELKRLIELEEAERKRNAAAAGSPKLSSTTSAATVSVNANTTLANDSLNGLRAVLKALEKEYGDLSTSSVDFESKSKSLAQSIVSTKNEIKNLTEATKLSVQENVVEVGSFRDVTNQLKELRSFVQTNATSSTNTINFRGQTLGITDAIQKFKELSAAEQDFRRQFAKDGLLVAEYSSGFVKAFKDLGLSDVFKKQRDDLNANLNQLKDQNRVLAEQYKELAKNGGDAFNKIDKDLRENIALQEQMEKSLQNINGTLGSTGSIGSNITKSLKEGFTTAKVQLGQFALTYVGFQAAISGAQNIVKVNFDFENSAQELKAITGVALEQLEFLKTKALETSDTTRFTAVDTLTAFKLIASAKPELLQDVDALNQIKDASVLLAQAAGTDLPVAVGSLTKTLNQFGAGAEESTKFVDALAAGAKFGAAEIPQITEALLDFGTQAKGANVSIFESTALIETLADKGIIGSEAGTKLRNVMLSLSAVEGLPKQALDSLKDFGVNTQILSDTTLPLQARLTELSKIAGDNAAILNVFGKENFNAAQIVLNSIPRYSELKTQIEETGVAQVQAADQTNTAATAFAKLKNQFNNLVTSDNVTTVLKGIAAALSSIMAVVTAIPFGIVLTGLALMTAAWAFYKGNVIAATIAQSANNEATLLGSVRLALMRSGLLGAAAQQQAFAIRAAAAAAATTAQATATGAATVATQGLNVAVRASPLGIILSVLLLLIPALTAFGSKLSENSAKIREQNNELKNFAQFNNDIVSSMQEQTAKTKNSVSELVDIIKTEVNNQNLRKRAYEELIKIAPDFRGTLDAEFNATERLNTVYDKFIAQLDKVSRAKAIRTVKDKIETDKVEKQTAEFNAKLDADEEARTNKDIERTNKAIALEGISSNSLGGAGAAAVRIQKMQKDKAEAYVKAKQEAELATRKAADFNKFITDKLTPEEKLALVGSQTVTTAGTGPTSFKSAVGGTIDELKGQLAGVNNEISQIDRIAAKTQEQIKKLKELRTAKAEIIRQIREQGGTATATQPRADRLSVNDQNQFKDVDAVRNQQLAQQKLSFVQGTINEEAYLKAILAINQAAIDKKLSLIKGGNAEERRQIAELHLDRINQEQETSKKLFEIASKREETALKSTVRGARSTLNTVLEDPKSTATQRATATQEFNNSELLAQTTFNKNVEELEKQHNQVSIQSAESRSASLEEINKRIRATEKSISLAGIEDTKAEGVRITRQIEIDYSVIRKKILDNDKLTSEQKSKQIEELDKAEKRTILSAELDTLNKEVVLKKALLDAGLLSGDDYLAAVAAQTKKAEDLSKASPANTTIVRQPTTVAGQAQNSIGKALGFKPGSAEDQLLAETIAQSFNSAEAAMNGYFDAERRRIDESRQLAFDRIDLEKEQALKTAQSQAERDSIEKQATVKKKAADKKAFDEQKKVQIAQAQINLATQLSNLAVIAFAPGPANLLTLGVAGSIMYAIQAALAIAGYAANVGRINAAKAFATGGKVEPERLSNGRITSRQNISTQPNGDNILATVRVGEVILNEEQQRRLGGAATFKRLGVPGFATGGLIGTLGGTFPGQSLLPPVNPSSFLNINSNQGVSEDVQELKKMVALVAGNVNNVTEHVRTLRVVNIATETAAVNNKLIKASNIGTL